MKQSETVVILVTYHPTQRTEQLIRSMSEANEEIIIVDNGSGSNDVLNQINAQQVTLIRLKENKGLAYAQNEGIKEAKKQGKKGLFFFDQDSEIDQNFFNQMVDEYNRLLKDYNIGILAPNLYDRNLKEYGRYAKLTPTGYETVHTIQEATRVDFVVSSASFMPMDVFLDEEGRLQRYVDEFFIDQVDTEWSLRLKRKGKDIVVTPRVIFKHTIGERTEHHLLHLTVRPNHHGPLRKFYIVRNGLKCVEWYGKEFPGFKKLMYHRLIHDLLGVIFYEDNKWIKLKAMWAGFINSNKDIREWCSNE
ncbi:glycosyltransferase family 2 protein [Atopobacter phocae]|uniref:glycosyltransferase family 2 protein n=1 Tax=Atopobacter phocae TaxID=136492 RepID=UPI00046E5BC7|nr:glycosyltransferase family 2 protein [Atopobacter phocae]